MPLSKEAITEIQNTANAQLFINQIAQADMPLALTPENFSVKNLEEFMHLRSRLRINFRTDSLNDFIAYCIEHGSANSGCFIDSSSMSAQCVFDIGSVDAPLHQVHKANILLNKTGPYKALLGIHENTLSQKDAAEFMEDWSDVMTVTDSSGVNLQPSIAAQRLRDLTIERAQQVSSRVEDFGASLSAMDSIEAKNKDSLPSEIKFTCEPYNGLSEHMFSIRLSILTGGEKPKISMRILRLESEQEAVTENFKTILTTAFDDCPFKTYIGKI